MTSKDVPSAEEIILYSKDPATKIATITLNRPDHLNAPTVDARLRYAEMIHRANIDDDVKVLLIRGAGSNLGSGVDLPDFLAGRGPDATNDELLHEFKLDGTDVVYPPRGSLRHGATIGQWFANPESGCRTLQDFKKISIVEAKGYCYGWHFYQAADADLVIASEDTLFGHAAFRYAGWGPRMWTWAQMMGLRKFQEMVFTGRPFTAQEMYQCNFVNRVVPIDQLDAEVEKYALACSRTRPTDTVFVQKVLFEIMKQSQGEYMGSILTALVESMGSQVQPDASDLQLTEETLDEGLAKSVKSNDEQFPPDFRLSKAGRRAPS